MIVRYLPRFWNRSRARDWTPCPISCEPSLNTAMETERQQHLGVDRYERSPERRGSANGFKPKPMTTRVGAVTFAVPQVRDGSFYPSALKRGLRSERARPWRWPNCMSTACPPAGSLPSPNTSAGANCRQAK